MSSYIIPIILIILFIFCFVKNVNAYDHFISGAKGAINLCVNTFPYLVAIFCAVELFKISGVSDKVSDFIEPVFKFLGIPKELSNFMVLRPFSGSGSMAMLTELYQTYGPDSYVSKCASIIISCTETVFYVVAVYFSSVKIKKLKGTVFLALLSTFLGSVLACQICRFF